MFLLSTQVASSSMHEKIQTYFDACYAALEDKIRASLFAHDNEIYGELYYYSVVKLLSNLTINPCDHFLDIGSGLGKLVFQVFLTTPAKAVTGIEINAARHEIAQNLKDTILHFQDNPFTALRSLNIIQGDFLKQDWTNVTIVYVCSTVFSYALLEAMGQKINNMQTVHTVVSLRKLADLLNFRLKKKIFLQGTWDKTVCYIYERKV